MSKKKSRGHYCYECGRRKSNESFSGQGHARNLCKTCRSALRRKNRRLRAAQEAAVAQAAQTAQVQEGPVLSAWPFGESDPPF